MTHQTSCVCTLVPHDKLTNWQPLLVPGEQLLSEVPGGKLMMAQLGAGNGSKLMHAMPI